MYLSNAFSINMIADDCTVDFVNLGPKAAASYLVVNGITNAIGHADTDVVVRNLIVDSSTLTHDDLPVGSRMTVALDKGDKMIVAQYHGPRLPEGATSLPDGATIKWWLVQVNH